MIFLIHIYEDIDKLESIGLRVPVLPKLTEMLDDFSILFREVLGFSHIGTHVVQLPGNFVLQRILWFLGYGLGDEFPFAVSNGSATTKLKEDGFIPLATPSLGAQATCSPPVRE